VTFSFLEQPREVWPVTVRCQTLGVSPQGFYAWRWRPKSDQRQRRHALLVEIRAVHALVKGRYGSPRLAAELQAQGVPCGVNPVAKLRRDNDILAKTARKFRHPSDSDHSLPVADNLLSREFEAQGPNERWLRDLTYLPTRQGWLYLAVLEDL
jgi:putative transposase